MIDSINNLGESLELNVLGAFLQGERRYFNVDAMNGASNAKNGAPKMMLGFIVRRCAADLGHMPSPDEFAVWANGQKQNGYRYCLFGKPISPVAAKIMLRQPGRLVTVRPEGFATIGRDDR
jgi:hypothetical protein